MSPASYSAAVATFRRPASLREVLDGLSGQHLLPTLVVVADNDPERSGEAVVADVDARSPFRILYVPMDANAGPSGAWSAAVARALTEADHGQWIGVFDDDDPIIDPRVMCRLLERAGGAPADVAAVGMRGARLRRWSATLRRVESTDTDSGSADYLASNGAPLYRCDAIERLGFFDGDLFFGFEDLDLGLRLRAAGFRLLVDPLDGIHRVADSAPSRTPWREYFKTRSLVVICRRHLGLLPLLSTMARALVLAAPALGVRSGPGLVVARWCGAHDGLRNRLGPRRWAPADNPAKLQAGGRSG